MTSIANDHIRRHKQSSEMFRVDLQTNFDINSYNHALCSYDLSPQLSLQLNKTFQHFSVMMVK